MAEDSTDRHVARWRNRADLGITFDDDVEAIVTRIQRLSGDLRFLKQRGSTAAGLEDYEYDTLHSLMIRDTPGHASPSTLAADLRISNAGMTGRLDALTKAGWVTRTTGTGDRRRVEIEITDAGREIWARAMTEVGHGEDELVDVLTLAERATLSTLLKKLALAGEAVRARD